MSEKKEYVRWFGDLGSDEVQTVGGKNASMGEMIRSLKGKGIRVPDGFAATAEAYWEFIDANKMRDRIEEHLKEWKEEKTKLEKAGKAIRILFLHADIPESITGTIRDAYHELCKRYSTEDVDVAVRSSATAEDLPDSRAGQQGRTDQHGKKSGIMRSAPIYQNARNRVLCRDDKGTSSPARFQRRRTLRRA